MVNNYITTDLPFEEIANMLARSANHKVLHKFNKVDKYNAANNEDKFIGVFVDVETTGLDKSKDKIIELALVPFEYTKDGRIFRILDSYCSFQDPGEPISQHVTSLTGITNEMVKGHAINNSCVEEIIKSANLIIAHNADFDRKFIEKQFPIFIEKPWACTYTQIGWVEEGIASAKLEYLAYSFNFFYEAHRAEIDCLVGIHLLSQILPVSGKSALNVLLDGARKNMYLIWAEGSPYDAKDVLKARGYRWNDGNNNKPKAWFIEVSSDLKDEEINFLYQEIYKRKPDLRIDEINAFNRFSGR